MANTNANAMRMKRRKRKSSNRTNLSSNENIDSDNTTTDNPIPSDAPAIRSRPTNDTNKFTNKTRSNDGDHSSGIYFINNPMSDKILCCYGGHSI